MHTRRSGYAAQVAQLRQLADAGMHVQRIAVTMGMHRCTIWRMARRHGIELERRPRNASGRPTIRSHLEWQRLYDMHGPSVTAVAKAVGLNRTYVTWQLWKHGIREMPDKWVDAQDEEMVA